MARLRCRAQRALKGLPSDCEDFQILVSVCRGINDAAVEVLFKLASLPMLPQTEMSQALHSRWPLPASV